MDLPGLSDSVVSIAEQLPECPICGTEARVNGGSCVGCLLRTGLEEVAAGEPESFDEVLSEIVVRDTDWRLGNYQILEEIGRGGMGVIYRARQRHSKRIVALKRVLSYHGDSRETLERFRREAEAAASLDHPNILPIYEVSESEGLPFFTMKYATGGSLQQAAAGLSAEPRECVRLLAKIARAVAYAHREGILHRDLKPGNILLDARGEPMVSDFGLAKWIDTSTDLTRSLTIFGTPGYIAPEQAEGPAAALTPAADVYSLGAILFDLLTGRPPFLGEHAVAVIRQAAEKPAPKLRSLVPKTGRDLETICAKCLEREPQLRYRATADLASDLELWLEGRAIVARPVSLPTHAWRWSRRNPVLAGAIAACLALGGASMVWKVEQRRLEKQVRAEETLAHSVAVIPFLDVDKIGGNETLAGAVADSLNTETGRYGPGRVRAFGGFPRHWTGLGTKAEMEEAARRLHCRGALTGVVRRQPDGIRLSLRLLRTNDSTPLGHWIVSGRDEAEIRRQLQVTGVAARMHALLGNGDEEAGDTPEIDPGLTNDTTRELITSGRWLIDRGRATVADLDRAINCLNHAVELEPDSAAAHAYLSMACLGRYVNSSEHAMGARALAQARLAVRLSPTNETANRALRVTLATNGHYAEALEEGLASLELSGSTERTFGNIAYFWNMLGHPEKAIAWYRQAKASGQQLADYEALLGDCWTALELDANAEAAYQSSIRLRGDLPDGAVGLARLKMLQGDFDEARRLCRETAAAYPTSPHPRLMLAQVEFFSRAAAAAESSYEELWRSDPDGGARGEFYGAIGFRAALACLKMEHGDRAAANVLLHECEESIATALAESPQSPPLLYRQAACKATQGDIPAALRQLRAATAAGWIDYRGLRMDPRFDALAQEPEFAQITREMESRVAEMRKPFLGENKN